MKFLVFLRIENNIQSNNFFSIYLQLCITKYNKMEEGLKMVA